MERVGTKNPKAQDDGTEGRQMNLLDSFAILFGSSLTMGEKRKQRSEKITSQKTSW
jgi:hypothetical protein